MATTIGCRQLELEGVVDVLGIVCQLRTDRYKCFTVFLLKFVTVSLFSY